MDDVVGTGPEEHLMSDFEHMKTRLYLADHKTSRSFEVKHSTEFVESVSNLYGLENSKLAAHPGGRSTVMEPGKAMLLDGDDHTNFRTAVEKPIFMAPWRPDMQFAIQQLSTQVLNLTPENQHAVKQVIRYLKGTQNTCLRLEPHNSVQKGMIELVGRGDRLGHTRQRAKVLRDITAVCKE